MSIKEPGPGRVFLSVPPRAGEPTEAGRPDGGAQGRVAPASGRGRALLAAALLLVPLCLGQPPLCGTSHAASSAREQPAKAQKKPLHGQPWAFGQSEDRKAALWRRGVPAQSLKQRAVTGNGAATGGAAGTGTSGRGATGKTGAGKGAMDTGSGIDSALSAAQAASQAGGGTAASTQEAKPKGSLGLSMENETTTWNVTPMREAMRPDEVQARDRRHVLRAFADMEPAEDLSISVGPELILKDEQHSAEGAGSSQPDSALGLGMQFKLDF